MGAARRISTELTTEPRAEYFRGNLFANTPDILNEYLVHGGRPAFRVRLVLAATLSPLYGIYTGYELFENVPVQGTGARSISTPRSTRSGARDWDAAGNINADIAAAQPDPAREPGAAALRESDVPHV